jgi:hypothetical protein
MFLESADREVPQENTSSTDAGIIAQIFDSEFGSIARQILAKLDNNADGGINKKQLSRALEDPSFNGKEAQALAAMYDSFDYLQNLSGHRSLLSEKTLTAGDLDKYGQMLDDLIRTDRLALDLKNWAQNNFSKVDRDGSGSLSKPEIDAALADHSLSESDRGMLLAIQNNFAKLGDAGQMSINLKSFDDFRIESRYSSPAGRLCEKIYDATRAVSLGQSPEISHALYADSQNPIASINPDGVRQGFIGDCYFLSSLAAVAKAHPEMIRDAIKDNGNGTYTVAFAGDKDNPITVKAPTEAEQGLYHHGSPYGIWGSVMEKAYGSYRYQHLFRRMVANLFQSAPPAEGADRGGNPADAIRLLTGSEVWTKSTLLNRQSTIAAQLEKALRHQPAQAVTAATGLPISGRTFVDGIRQSHVFTVTEFTGAGADGGTITLRDPSGKEDGSRSGTFQLPLDQFMQKFSYLSIEH